MKKVQVRCKLDAIQLEAFKLLRLVLIIMQHQVNQIVPHNNKVHRVNAIHALLQSPIYSQNMRSF